MKSRGRANPTSIHAVESFTNRTGEGKDRKLNVLTRQTENGLDADSLVVGNWRHLIWHNTPLPRSLSLVYGIDIFNIRSYLL